MIATVYAPIINFTVTNVIFDRPIKINLSVCLSVFTLHGGYLNSYFNTNF